jgi:hypothetical protein
MAGSMNDRSHLSRLLGLLLAVSVLAVASRWLQSDPEAASPPIAGDAAGDAEPARRGDLPLRIAEAADADAPPPADTHRPARLGGQPGAPETVSMHAARPISAALCHALDERLRALDHRAEGSLARHEQRTLRAERQRAREMLQGLRCRAGGDRYWF